VVDPSRQLGEIRNNAEGHRLSILPPLPPAPSANLVLFSTAQWNWLTAALRALHAGQDTILEVDGQIMTALETIMATSQELQVKLDALTAANAENARRSTDEFDQLKAALAAIKPGEPVSQAQLDQVQAVVDAMTARSAKFASDDPVAPPAPPTP
jgi:hypothetical protein